MTWMLLDHTKCDGFFNVFCVLTTIFIITNSTPEPCVNEEPFERLEEKRICFVSFSSECKHIFLTPVPVSVGSVSPVDPDALLITGASCPEAALLFGVLIWCLQMLGSLKKAPGKCSLYCVSLLQSAHTHKRHYSLCVVYGSTWCVCMWYVCMWCLCRCARVGV